MTSDTHSELLPCPFCGGKAREDRTDRDDDCAAPRPHRVYRVECTSCDAFRESESADWFMSSFSPHPETPADLAAKADAIAAWNRRTPPKVGSGELDAAARHAAHRAFWESNVGNPMKVMIDNALRAYLALAAPVDHPEVVGGETGWLIELRGNEPMWWTLDPTDEPCWTKESLKALRFARKVDADAYISDIGWTEAFATEHMRPGHPDDLAVDRFAAAMKAKLALKREQGRGGWDGPDCTALKLSDMLRAHFVKGDPLDVGNLAMMIHQRGERIV